MFRRLKALLMWGDRSPRARQHRLFCLACVVLIALSAAYVIGYFADRARVREEGDAYRALYSPAPLATARAAAASPAPRASRFSCIPEPSASPASSESPAPSASPVSRNPPRPPPPPRRPPRPRRSRAWSIRRSRRWPRRTRTRSSTRLPTQGAPQDSFAELLRYNPDTVGYLVAIGRIVDLPVVQRENDNEYYLTHSLFRRGGARGGAVSRRRQPPGRREPHRLRPQHAQRHHVRGIALPS